MFSACYAPYHHTHKREQFLTLIGLFSKRVVFMEHMHDVTDDLVEKDLVLLYAALDPLVTLEEAELLQHVLVFVRHNLEVASALLRFLASLLKRNAIEMLVNPGKYAWGKLKFGQEKMLKKNIFLEETRQ